MKKLFVLLLLVAMMVSLLACGKEMVTMHCDLCGKEVQVEKARKDMNDAEWFIACDDCANQELD